MERKSMGSFLAALRKANGLTQKDLAERLNVSDKSVSRWERDEGAPDLSLIPIIAETFSITSDELLRGVRRPPSETAQAEVPHPLAEKQRQRLLATSLYRYKNKSLAASGLAICGLLAALIGNFAFLRAYIGFFAGTVFLLAAVIVQLMCANTALLAVNDSELAEVKIGRFKQSVIFYAEKVIGLAITLFGASLSLLVFVDTAYGGLNIEWFLKYGLLFGTLALLLFCLLCYFLNHMLLENGSYALDEKRGIVYRHNYKLKRHCTLALLAVLMVTLFVNGALTAWGDFPALSAGTVFADFNSFKVYMEQDIPDPYDSVDSAAPTPFSPSQYFDEHGNPITEEQALTHTITDDAGTVLCTFIYRNQSVRSWRYASRQVSSVDDLTNGSIAEIIPITVYTAQDYNMAWQKVDFINRCFILVYLAELGAVLFVYYYKRKKYVC